MYTKHFNTRETPQSEKIPGTSQVENSAGGFSFAVNDWTRFERFLILGSEGGSYYASERQLTRENAESVMRCVESDGARAVKLISDISSSGRAPKNDPALFALVIACTAKEQKTREIAFRALPSVARTGTHLMMFAEFMKGFRRGWGSGLVRAVARWYTQMPVEKMAYQVVKYRSRSVPGMKQSAWSARDLMRKSHPFGNEAQNAVFDWVTKGNVSDKLPQVIQDFVRLQSAKTADEVVNTLASNPNLTWEMVQSQFLGDVKVWEVLLPNMQMTATLRNLARMTANGLLAPMSEATRLVVERLGNIEHLRSARVHPLSALVALNTYQKGEGARGSLKWTPVSQICDALDSAFYASFGNIEPTGKRVLLALDVSGSMGWGEISGMPGITPRVGSAAMALVTAAVESNYHIMGFTHDFIPLAISPRQRLDDVVRAIDNLEFGATDCAIPMMWALQNRVQVDTFVVYTDSETWAGSIQPSQALSRYREEMGIPAKLVVVGMVSNGFSIADSNDAGMLDVVGFDTATPNVISDFAKS